MKRKHNKADEPEQREEGWQVWIVLCIRFYYCGKLEHDRKDWQYRVGKSGMSTVRICNLSLSELKRNLSDHISISVADLENTSLTWRLVDKECNYNLEL